MKPIAKKYFEKTVNRAISAEIFELEEIMAMVHELGRVGISRSATYLEVLDRIVGRALLVCHKDSVLADTISRCRDSYAKVIDTK